MAHIPDGILGLPVLIGGGVAAAAGLAVALRGEGGRGLDDRAIIRIALLAAVFFAGSLIAVPVGPSSVHLMLAGLMGVMLGPGIFAAVAVALALQAALFGMGGLTTLGVNTVNIALPGALVGLVLGPAIRAAAAALAPQRAALLAGVGAGLAVAGTAAGVSLVLWLSAPEFTPLARVLALTYLPLALVEGGVTAMVVGFLARVEPGALSPLATPVLAEVPAE